MIEKNTTEYNKNAFCDQLHVNLKPRPALARMPDTFLKLGTVPPPPPPHGNELTDCLVTQHDLLFLIILFFFSVYVALSQSTTYCF